MTNTLIYRSQVLTGGASNAVDGIDGNKLYGGELNIVHTAAKLFYVYQLNATSAQAESVPAIIAPDINPGDKRWELLAMINQTILLPDTDNSHNLIIQSGENLTADRILSIILGDAARSLTFTGNASVSGSNTGDQELTDYALKTYVDSAVVGLLCDCGNYDASGDVFPSSGGSGTAGAILKGNLWIISVAGTLGGASVTAGDQIRALCDTPGQTASNWAISEAKIGYAPANDTAVLHKATSGEIAAITEKTSLADADVVLIEDSAAGNSKKRISGANIKAAMGGLTFATAAEIIAGTETDKVIAPDQLKAAKMFVPIGTELLWPTETPPEGWLEEDGSSLVRATYPDLFDVIGTMYGAADDAHFNLPDSRGKFPRIWAHGQTTDPDRASRTVPTPAGATIVAGDHVGTEQVDEFKSHRHTSGFGPQTTATPAAASYYAGAVTYNTGYAGGNETRPINTYRMIIIKAY